MVSSISNSKTSTVVVAAAAISTLLLYTMAKKKKKAAPLRAVGRVSHLRISTPDLSQSVAFYKAFGFELVGEINGGKAVLKCPGEKLHQPWIVLEEDPKYPKLERNASHVGIGRFCFAVADVNAEVDRLKNLGFQPVGPIMTDRPGTAVNGVNKEPECTIVAYADPSGVQVELVSSQTNLIIKTLMKLNGIQMPIMVHVNVNGSNYQTSLKAYQKLGFTKVFKYYGKTVNTLYKALKIPDPGVANEVCLIKTPKEDFFSIDLIEWENPSLPKGVKPGKVIPSPIRFALTVDDIPLFTDDILDNGWSLESPPSYESLPSHSLKAIVATVKDPDGVKVELVQYPTTEFDASQKVVVITGCDSGFGRSLAVRCVGLGFEVVAACYTKEGAEYLNGLATTIVTDLSIQGGPEEVVKITQQILKSGSRKLWGIINNAGMASPGNVEWMHPDIYKKTMSLNFHAPIGIIYGLLPHIKQVRGARIIQMSSVCGFLSQPINSTYCSTKHALESYSDGLRAEMHPYGVHVCIIQPATMRTPLAMSFWDGYKKNFLNAPADRHPALHRDKFDKFIKEKDQELSDLAEDPRVTIEAVVKALVAKDGPPTRICTGGLGKVFKFISYLPDRRRDAFLYKEMENDVLIKES